MASLPAPPSRYLRSSVSRAALTTQQDNLTNLFSAIMALKALPWFPASVRDIRAFKIEHWSDFPQFIKA